MVDLNDDDLAAVFSALLRDKQSLAASMTASLRAKIPFYGERQSEFRRSDLMYTLGSSIDAFIEYGTEHVAGNASSRLLEINRQRVTEGVPLEIMQDAWRIGSHEIWLWLSRLPENRSARNQSIVHLWSLWLEFMDVHTPKVTGAYLEARREADLAESVAVSYTLKHLLREAGPVETERTLRRLGVTGEEVVVALFVADDRLAADEDPMRRFGALIQAASSTSGGRTPSMFFEEHLLMVIPGGDRSLTAIQTTAASLPFRVRGGVSRSAPLRSHLGDLHRQAQLALSGATTSEPFVDFGRLPMTQVLALTSTVAWGDLPSWIRRFFREDTRRAGEWIQTVRALWENLLHVKTASEALHVHSNTVYYRLGAVERECGVDLRDPGVLVSIVVVDDCRSIGTLTPLPPDEAECGDEA